SPTRRSAPSTSRRSTASAASDRPPTMTRVRGLDAARGLALVGMVIAHLDTRIDFDPGVAASWRHVGDGRAAVLFVVVAGFSLALSTGGSAPHTGRRLADDRLAVLVRSAVLAGLGT